MKRIILWLLKQMEMSCKTSYYAELEEYAKTMSEAYRYEAYRWGDKMRRVRAAIKEVEKI